MSAGTARPAWIDATLHAVGRILRRRRFTAAVALLGSIALIALSIVPDAVCIELKSDDAASTRGDGADLGRRPRLSRHGELTLTVTFKVWRWTIHNTEQKTCQFWLLTFWLLTVPSYSI